MELTRKTRTLSMKIPPRLYMVAGISSLVLAAGVVLIATRTVQADALLRPTLNTPAAAPITSPAPATLATGNKEHGVASWYGGVFNGRKTASGERFNMYAMTACHPTLPFGSLVRVVNLKNHRSVVVRITDRGDLVEQDRIIDLSYGAAQKLAMVHVGLTQVELKVLKRGKNRIQ